MLVELRGEIQLRCGSLPVEKDFETGGEDVFSVGVITTSPPLPPSISSLSTLSLLSFLLSLHLSSQSNFIPSNHSNIKYKCSLNNASLFESSPVQCRRLSLSPKPPAEGGSTARPQLGAQRDNITETNSTFATEAFLLEVSVYQSGSNPFACNLGVSLSSKHPSPHPFPSPYDKVTIRDSSPPFDPLEPL